MQESNFDEYQGVLFGPRSAKHLFQQYPELKSKDGISHLKSAQDIFFCWLMGIPGSPVDEEWEDSRRRYAAAKKAYPNDAEKIAYLRDNPFSEEMKTAIHTFSRFKPEARMLADRITQRAFFNMQKLVNVNVDDEFKVTKRIKGPNGEMEEITETDWSAKKSYTDTVDKIIKMTPELIDRLEKGYGIKEKKNDTEMEKPIDLFHKGHRADRADK